MLNLNKCTKIKPKTIARSIVGGNIHSVLLYCIVTAHRCVQIIVRSSDNFPSYLPITITHMMSAGGQRDYGARFFMPDALPQIKIRKTDK